MATLTSHDEGALFINPFFFPRNRKPPPTKDGATSVCYRTFVSRSLERPFFPLAVRSRFFSACPWEQVWESIALADLPAFSDVFLSFPSVWGRSFQNRPSTTKRPCPHLHAEKGPIFRSLCRLPPHCYFAPLEYFSPPVTLHSGLFP